MEKGNPYKWSGRIENGMRSGDPLKAALTTLISYFPAVFEMIKNGDLKEKSDGFKLLLISPLALPTGALASAADALLNEKRPPIG